MIPVEHSRALHEAIPGSQYAELAAGHFAVFEKQAELAELIREFLESDEAAAA